jgi:hypothetical protein
MLAWCWAGILHKQQKDAKPHLKATQSTENGNLWIGFDNRTLQEEENKWIAAQKTHNT